MLGTGSEVYCFGGYRVEGYGMWDSYCKYMVPFHMRNISCGAWYEVPYSYKLASGCSGSCTGKNTYGGGGNYVIALYMGFLWKNGVSSRTSL